MSNDGPLARACVLPPISDIRVRHSARSVFVPTIRKISEGFSPPASGNHRWSAARRSSRGRRTWGLPDGVGALSQGMPMVPRSEGEESTLSAVYPARPAGNPAVSAGSCRRWGITPSQIRPSIILLSGYLGWHGSGIPPPVVPTAGVGCSTSRRCCYGNGSGCSRRDRPGRDRPLHRPPGLTYW